MNRVGENYLALKFLMQKRNRSRLSPQQRMTEKFLEQWESHLNIDPNKLLHKILTYTALHVPFYRTYFAQNSRLNPEVVTDWPILSRSMLRAEFNNLQTDLTRNFRTWTHASGGSTGEPVTVVHDEYFAAKAQALRDLCAKLFFEGPHYNKVILWGMSSEVKSQKASASSIALRIKDELRRLAGLKTTHIDTFNLDRKTLEVAVQAIRHQKPEFIFGYAGSVYQLARFIEDNQISIPRSVHIIGTTAQTLYPFMRSKIEAVFGCRISDHYGSREVGPVAWQHRDGAMCFPRFFSHIEVVNENGKPCATGEEGRILVTDLHNFTMPLVRYDMGDLGVKAEDTEFDGYSFARLQAITGRTSDEFVRPDGSLVHSQYFTTLFYDRPWVMEFCVVQKAYEQVEIHYVAAKAAPARDLQEIEAGIRQALTPTTKVHWQQVDQVPKTRAGKRLFVRSEVPH